MIHLDLCVIQFYVVLVFHLVKQRAKPLGFLLVYIDTNLLSAVVSHAEISMQSQADAVKGAITISWYINGCELFARNIKVLLAQLLPPVHPI